MHDTSGPLPGGLTVGRYTQRAVWLRHRHPATSTRLGPQKRVGAGPRCLCCLGAYGQGVVEHVAGVPPRLDLLESGVVVLVVQGVPRDAGGIPLRIGEVDVRWLMSAPLLPSPGTGTPRCQRISPDRTGEPTTWSGPPGRGSRGPRVAVLMGCPPALIPPHGQARTG